MIDPTQLNIGDEFFSTEIDYKWEKVVAFDKNKNRHEVGKRVTVEYQSTYKVVDVSTTTYRSGQTAENYAIVEYNRPVVEGICEKKTTTYAIPFESPMWNKLFM